MIFSKINPKKHLSLANLMFGQFCSAVGILLTISPPPPIPIKRALLELLIISLKDFLADN
jgi:hypothetical protein